MLIMKHSSLLNCIPRSESLNGLEVYLHAFQLLSTIDEGIQVFGKSSSYNYSP